MARTARQTPTERHRVLRGVFLEVPAAAHRPQVATRADLVAYAIVGDRTSDRPSDPPAVRGG